MQRAWFTAHEECLRLPLVGADLMLWPHWLSPVQADALLQALRDEIPFTQHRLHLFGRWLDAPRLSCWIGDPGASYRYAGACFTPQPWTPLLTRLRQRAGIACATSFNSVLANLYRDGDDAIGRHSDDEPELGSTPVIASVSLGAERCFQLRARSESGESLDIHLPHGSLLRMAGATQRNYHHALPRRRRVTGARLNLTFRCIL